LRKQFDIIVYPSKEGAPEVEDPALEWFFVENINEALYQGDAEWIIIAHRNTRITVDLLNSIADATLEFSQVDAFAPWIQDAENSTQIISSGSLLSKTKGTLPEFLGEYKPQSLRFVASPSPYLTVLSRRIQKRIGGFDENLQSELRFLDMGLRLYHAGGSLCSLPHILAKANRIESVVSKKKYRQELAAILYKDLDFSFLLPYLWRHPSTIPFLFRNKKSLDLKSLKATELSKFSEEMRQSITL
jgi:hypothetical protein